MGKVKEWLIDAADATGLDPVRDADKLSKLFNLSNGSTDPDVLKAKLEELPGLHFPV